MKNFYIRKILAVLSAVLMYLGFPLLEAWYMPWVALIPLFFAIYEEKPKQAFFTGCVWGFVFFLLNLIYLKIFGVLPWILKAGIESLYYGLMFYIIAYFFSLTGSFFMRLFFIPSIFVCMEYLRTLGFAGSTWGDIYYTQYRLFPYFKLINITGCYGITFFVVLFNYILFLWLKKDMQKQKLIFTTFLFLIFMLLIIVNGITTKNNDISEKSLKIAVIQPNISQEEKWKSTNFDSIINKLRFLTEKASKMGAKLVIWPETAVPSFIFEDLKYQDILSEISIKNNIFLLTGTVGGNIGVRAYNVAVMFDSRGYLVDEYRKIHLVPFGEYLPFRKTLGKYKVFERCQEFSPGRRYVMFSVNGMKFGVLICFESIFPYMARKYVLEGADFLVVITNDAWFEKTPASKDHFLLTASRAYECGINILQSANTGISGVISSYGKIIYQTSLDTDDIVIYEVKKPNNNINFYVEFGDLFVLLCFFVVLFLILYGYAKDKIKGV